MTWKRKNIWQMAISALFVLILLLPSMQMITGTLNLETLNENRTMAAAPSFADMINPLKFIYQAQKWFDDHYGLRALLIRLKTQIDYTVFGVSDKVYIGKDGWLYYRNIIDDSEPRVEALTDAELDADVQWFAELRDILAARGIKLIVITNQLKDKFYPEYLPKAASRAKHQHRFDDFRARLHSLPGITYIDTTEGLLALKQRGEIFHKTDFHWNDPTAAVFAQILVDTIARQEHRPLPFWRSRYTVVTHSFSGGEATFMPLFVTPVEQSFFVECPTPWNDTVHPPWETVWHSTMTDPPPLPTTVLYADSFMDGFERSGLYDYFEESLRVRRGSASLAETLAAMPPTTRYFIYQFIETELPDVKRPFQ
jgi:hypothetical protein